MIDVLNEEFDELHIIFRNDIYAKVSKNKVYEFKIGNIKKGSYLEPDKKVPTEYNITSDLVLILDKDYCKSTNILDWWDDTIIKKSTLEDILFQKRLVRIEIVNKTKIVDSFEIDWDYEHNKKNLRENEKIINNRIAIKIAKQY